MKGKAPEGTVNFALNQKAEKYADENKVPFSEALIHVAREESKAAQ